MKMILLLYLEDDAARVRSLLEGHDVLAYSELPLEGHGEGRPAGWYGQVAPFRSRMAFMVLPEARAAQLLEAVRTFGGGQDSRHPIHALQLGVEEVARSGASSSTA